MLRILLLSIIAVTTACNHAIGFDVTEISGIARNGNKLIMVSDDAAGTYYELALTPSDTSVIPIDPLKVRRVRLPGCEAASDLEGIDVLADGRIALLSEDLHCLFAVSADGFTCSALMRFNSSVTEKGNRGVEGLAVYPLSDERSRIAVTWEGGYPLKSLLPVVRGIRATQAAEPILILAEIKKNDRDLWLVDTTAYRTVVTPKEKSAGPLGQRFRVPDLVWHRWSEAAGMDTGLIMILSSENNPPDDSGEKTEYKHKLLMRYDTNGQPVGSPIDINAQAKVRFNAINPDLMADWSQQTRTHFVKIRSLLEDHDWENVNWEGMGWFETGRQLVLTYDASPGDPPFAVTIDIPEEWK